MTLLAILIAVAVTGLISAAMLYPVVRDRIATFFTRRQS